MRQNQVLRKVCTTDYVDSIMQLYVIFDDLLSGKQTLLCFPNSRNPFGSKVEKNTEISGTSNLFKC